MSTMSSIPLETTLFVKDHCLCLHTQRAARAMARVFDKALKPHGINNGQFSLLMSLNQPFPPSVSDIAMILAMDATTVTAKLKPLIARELVQVMPDAKDKRTRRVAMTDEGKVVLEGAFETWKQTHAVLEDLFDDGCEQLRGGLQRLVEQELSD